MTQMVDQTPLTAPTTQATDTDLVALVQQVLRDSEEPLTLSKIRSLLPASQRGINLDELAEKLRRQVDARVLYQYPKYRSQQDRFWDRPMEVHIARLLCTALEEQPLPWSELRRKLPIYAQAQAETILQEQLAQRKLHRHPRSGGRGSGDRFGVRPPDPKDYLRAELPTVFARLQGLGFTQAQLRAAALELLHEEEWSMTMPVEPPARPARQRSRRAAEQEESSAEAAPRAETPTEETSPGIRHDPAAPLGGPSPSSGQPSGAATPASEMSPTTPRDPDTTF